MGRGRSNQDHRRQSNCADAGGFRHDTVHGSCTKRGQGSSALERRVWTREPSHGRERADVERPKHRGQSFDHAVWAIGLELPRRESQPPAIRHRQERASLHTVMWRLA
jgi:hypothetical protein